MAKWHRGLKSELSTLPTDDYIHACFASISTPMPKSQTLCTIEPGRKSDLSRTSRTKGAKKGTASFQRQRTLNFSTRCELSLSPFPEQRIELEQSRSSMSQTKGTNSDAVRLVLDNIDMEITGPAAQAIALHVELKDKMGNGNLWRQNMQFSHGRMTTTNPPQVMDQTRRNGLRDSP
jgi:hypothetical protein